MGRFRRLCQEHRDRIYTFAFYYTGNREDAEDIAGRLLFDPEPVPPAFSPKEIAQARRQVEWTLAYLGDLNSRMGTTVRDDVIQSRLVQPLRLNLDTILPVQTM